MKILITSFGPFNNFKVNPSNLVMQLLKEKTLNNNLKDEFHWQTLDVSYDDVLKFEKGIKHENFDYIIHLGVATLDPIMRFETLAKNKRQGKDILGNNPNSKIIEEEKTEIISGIEIETLNKVIIKFPKFVRISYDAGEYLCNYIYYLSLSSNLANQKVMFIHIADFQNCANAVSLENQVNVISELLSELGDNQNPN